MRKEIDDFALKAAFASGDEAAVDREWHIWIAKLEALAEKNPPFVKWFDEFCKDQERFFRWEDMIGHDEGARLLRRKSRGVFIRINKLSETGLLGN